MMRGGPQLNNEQREMLTSPIPKKEAVDALQSMDNTKAPRIYGYGYGDRGKLFCFPFF